MWFFNSPKIVFGEEALSWLCELRAQRVFIVTDQTVTSLGFVQRVREQLPDGIEVAVFDEVEADPCLETVKRCALALTTFAPDWVIGLGGGSCIDAAKAAWFLYERPDISLEAINPMETFGLREKARLLTIPTTSGTGSDVSWGFALADTENQCKVVRVSYELVPDISLVDPSLVISLPAQVTADTGMDVLTHAIEGYSNTFANDFSDGMCLKAIQLVFDYLPRSFVDGTDLEARQHMHNASTIAGLGFSNTAIILAHALGHALGGVFHLPHGRAVGLFLPYTIEYIGSGSGGRYREIAYFLHLPAGSETEGADSLAGAVRDLQQKLNQPGSVQETGISRDEYQAALPHMVDSVLGAPELVATPRIPYGEDLERLFWYAYEGRRVDF